VRFSVRSAGSASYFSKTVCLVYWCASELLDGTQELDVIKLVGYGDFVILFLGDACLLVFRFSYLSFVLGGFFWVHGLASISLLVEKHLAWLEFYLGLRFLERVGVNKWFQSCSIEVVGFAFVGFILAVT